MKPFITLLSVVLLLMVAIPTWPAGNPLPEQTWPETFQVWVNTGVVDDRLDLRPQDTWPSASGYPASINNGCVFRLIHLIC